MDLVFATHNEHKLKEARLILPDHYKLLSLTDIGCVEEIPETSDTLEGNALLKANYVHDRYGYSCFADDTGLLVETLNGQPGVYSARFAGDHRSDSDNIDKLLKLLNRTEDRKACFVTVIALNLHGESRLFRGEVRGSITDKRRGHNGFGYDPVFEPCGYTQTFAEMPLSLKNSMSHRARALEQLSSLLTSERG